MQVGLEVNHLPGFTTRSPQASVSLAHELGFAGVFFKTVLDLSPTLDAAELTAIKQTADELGLYLDCGVGRVNPYNTAESPAVRALGDGDYRLGMERMIRAACTIGCTQLWAETATSSNKPYPGYFNIDRFRTDVAWADQLLATEKFLRILAPLLRDVGSRICLETHEEITSYEVVRLVEAVGPDVIGITFDTGNVVVRGEDPVAAARRVAPYTYLTHLKDPLLTFGPQGLVRRINPCGLGAIDWSAVLAILGAHNPHLHLTLEDHKNTLALPFYETPWQQMHPDLTVAELAELFRLAYTCEARIRQGLIPDPVSDEPIPYAEQWRERVLHSAAYLRQIMGAESNCRG
ncbi:MAG: sugar phosphate isomerase/epimerase [Chloroflexi bacterium]|nr:sugar phosphate isomerase/epimerase [Chloroflexota bacterium]